MIDLMQLNSLFAGQMVRITHTNKRLTDVSGVCRRVWTVPGEKGSFEMELKDGHRVTFVPEAVTSDSVEGELHAAAGGRRKIQIIDVVGEEGG